MWYSRQNTERRLFFGPIRKELKSVFHRLAAQKNCEIEEGHLMPDHVHMLIAIPLKQNFVGHKFWARGYYVSTAGADEKVIRAYIRNRESEDKRLDEPSLFDKSK